MLFPLPLPATAGSLSWFSAGEEKKSVLRIDDTLVTLCYDFCCEKRPCRSIASSSGRDYDFHKPGVRASLLTLPISGTS